MRFLHTADWHVGKTLKGRDRLAEQAAVLGEIVAIVRENQVDAVLVAGDLYETSAPSAEAQRLVVRTLLALSRTGAQVVAMAGNHDHPGTFDAYRPLMRAAGITLLGTARSAERGGVVSFTARTTGEPVDLAVVPFLSQRYAVRAAQLLAQTPAQNAGEYDLLVREVLAALTASFRAGAVNLIMAHLTCTGGVFGGGERPAQSIFEYHVPAAVFPPQAHYVALGHLHRCQELPAACPVHYSGSPYPVDFGEQDNTNVVLMVDVTATTPARVTQVPITSGRRLRTVHGTSAEIMARAAEFGEDYLRVVVREPTRAGLREDLCQVLPNALEVRIDPDFAAQVNAVRPDLSKLQRSPGELFAQFCAERNVADDRVSTLFATLHDEVTGPDQAPG